MFTKKHTSAFLISTLFQGFVSVQTLVKEGRFVAQLLWKDRTQSFCGTKNSTKGQTSHSSSHHVVAQKEVNTTTTLSKNIHGKSTRKKKKSSEN